jgi:hypothetical protein
MNRLLSPSRCRALGACLATALIAGCGGGHDDDRFDVRAGLRNLMTQPRALTLTGASGTVSYTLTLTSTPQQAGAYARTGAVGARSELVSRLWVSAAAIDTVSTMRHLDSDGLAFGSTDGSGRCTDISSTPTSALPTAALRTQSGPQAVHEEYDSCSASAIRRGQAASSWRLVGEDNDRWTMLCVQSVRITSTSLLVGALDEHCHEIASDGTIGARARATVTLSSGTALTMKNY